MIDETESAINYQDYYISRGNKHLNTAQAISHAACSVAYDQDIKILITMTHSGSTARMVSRYRPAARIVAMTPIEEISRQLSIVWGIMPIVINEYNLSSEIQDVANAVLSREDIHVSNIKGYLLPKTVDERTLVISTSISGNTKETLAILMKRAETEPDIREVLNSKINEYS